MKDHELTNAISESITKLKNDCVRQNLLKAYLCEMVPRSSSATLEIADGMLGKLNLFAQTNPIYSKELDLVLDGVPYKCYQGDINDYWLGSKKYDTCYQPFYPTWILSAWALALESKRLGFTELIDVGSGDGRIAYCASALGLNAFSIEINSELALLQKKISKSTNINYEILNVDATTFNYKSLSLSNPIFFISALPEVGDIMAKSVLTSVTQQLKLRNWIGFNFMGSHKMNTYTKDRTKWGWGDVIKSFKLQLVNCITLPTLWTNDQDTGTPYIYTKVKQT